MKRDFAKLALLAWIALQVTEVVRGREFALWLVMGLTWSAIAVLIARAIVALNPEPESDET